jgi:hypothetical protein
MGRACSTNGEEKNMCRILVGKPEGTRPLGRPRCRWVGHIQERQGGMVLTGLIWLSIGTSGGLL